MRDQELVKTLDNGSTILEPNDVFLSRSKESSAEDSRDVSPSSLLVEDVKVCDTCGNAGYEESLAVCSSCNEGAEHTYCMRIQMDSLPEREWLCEMCQIKQRHGGCKTLERFVVPSKSFGRLTSINNRSKPASNQSGSRSRLVDRMNNKKPRITTVRNSPSKAPILQTPVKRSANDYLVTNASRKLAMESTSWTTSSTLPPMSPVLTPLVKPSHTRENTFKSTFDTNKVRLLASSAVANFSSGARATAIKPAFVASQPPKAGQAGIKSRFASLSTISESSKPSNGATSLNFCRASLTASSTPVLLKSLSGKLSSDLSTLTKSSTTKLSAELPSILLNSNSRQGNVMKANGQIRNSRDCGVSDNGVSMPLSVADVPSPASQSSGSVNLGINISSGSTGEPRPSLDISRLNLEFGRGANRSGLTNELRPSPNTSRFSVEHGRGTHRLGPGIGGSSVAVTGQDTLNVGGKDKAFSGFDHTFGVGSAESGRVTLESVPGFLGMHSKPTTGIWSAPWLGKSSSTRCLLSETVRRTIQDCPDRSSVPLEPKVMSGLSNSPEISTNRFKNSVQVFSDVDPYDLEVGLEPVLYGLTNSSTGSQNSIESVPGGCSLDLEKSRIVLISPSSTDLMCGGSSEGNIHESLATGSTNPFLLIDAVFGAVPQVLQRVHPAWGSRAPWLESLSPHSVQGQGPGHAGYSTGVVQSFPPSGPVIYSQGPPMSYLTPQPSPFLPPYAPPAASPIHVDASVPSAAIAWRGAFEVNDGQSTIVFDKILGHVSSKAVVKVHEVSASMPQQLRLEQVQRATDLETWPRQFNIRPPTDGSIALYFFATNGESFKKFRHNLVDKMVARDLVLRGHVDGAELLIFPSNKLSEKFQRWHGHMFLWGVFRARKQFRKTVPTSAVVVKGPLVAAAPCFEASEFASSFMPADAPDNNITSEMLNLYSSSSGCDNTGVVDMEVDYEGAKECGMSDKPIKRLDSANPQSTPLSPTGASMKAPLASANLGSAPHYLVIDTDKADDVHRNPNSIKAESLDLPPGFAPALALPPTSVALEMLTPEATVVRGSAKRIEVHKQVDLGSCADGAVHSEQVGSKLKRSMNYLEVAKNSSTPQVSHLSASKSNAEHHLPSSRSPTTNPSGSSSRSSIQVKEKERDNVRDRLCERLKDRERRDVDTKYDRDYLDLSRRERAWELHRDRKNDRDYRRENGRERSRSRDRDCDLDSHDCSRKRGRTRDEDGVKERERARGRAVWDRQRERNRGREKERLLDREKDRKFYRTRESDQVLDSRIRYRRSRSRSRSRSARRKMRSRSPGAVRWKTRSRTPPPRHKTRSSSPSRRYPASFRQPSVSGSDSPDSQSIEILQGSTITGPRSWKLYRESVQGKRSIILNKDVGDKGSRLTTRWESVRTVDDTRSGSAGGSTSKTVGKFGHSNTMLVSRSVSPVMDMNGGVSEAFSTEGTTISISLPDLNTDSVESGVAFHDFLPVDESGPSREPEKANLIAEQASFPSATRAAVPLSLSTSLNFRSQKAEHTLVREGWGVAVSSVGSSCSDYTSGPSGCQLLHVPRSTNSVSNSSPDLELALGGRETSSERTLPLPLFVDGHAGRTPDLGLALNAKIPDLRVSLSTPHQLGPSGMVCGSTASLSLSLVVPHYRVEANSWVQVEGHGDMPDKHDVDFSLTL